MIISLSIYMIMINTIAIFFGSDIQVINIQKISNKSISIVGIVFTHIQLIQVIVSIIIILLILFILNKKRIGKEIIALSENMELFLTLGIRLNRTRNIALLISGILITTASILKSIEFGIEPNNIGFHTLLLGIIAVLIGGIHSYKGALFGGIFIGLVNNIGAWFFSGEWKEISAFVLLFVILIFKKNGLFSINLRLEE